jgi:hypothetical protein
MIRFFIDPGRFDLSNFFGLENDGNVGFLNYLNRGGIRDALNYILEQNIWLIIGLIIIGFVNTIKVIGLFLFLICRSIDIKYRLLIFSLIGYIAFATGPLGASRFSMPFIPIIIFTTLMAINKFGVLRNKYSSKISIDNNT